MAITSPNLGLTVWNLTTDPYNHDELAENFGKIDEHDHSGGKGTQIPTGGIKDGAVTIEKLAGSLPIPDGSVTDEKLASPNNSAYKPLHRSPFSVAGASTGTYTTFAESLGSLAPASGTSTASGPLNLFRLLSTDTTVANKTQTLLIRQQVIVGSTSPSTVTLNCGLYPVTISAGNYVIGSLVPDSATATSGLATNGIFNFASALGDFAFPANATYCLGIVIGSITCPAGIQSTALLETRHVS